MLILTCALFCRSIECTCKTLQCPSNRSHAVHFTWGYLKSLIIPVFCITEKTWNKVRKVFFRRRILHVLCVFKADHWHPCLFIYHFCTCPHVNGCSHMALVLLGNLQPCEVTNTGPSTVCIGSGEQAWFIRREGHCSVWYTWKTRAVETGKICSYRMHRAENLTMNP